MKRYTLALLITSSVALAGDASAQSAKSSKGGKDIVPKATSSWDWFAGASGGYLLENESAMINGHFGMDLPWKLAGFSQALFLEVGWTECGDDFEIKRKSNRKDGRGDRKGKSGKNDYKGGYDEMERRPSKGGGNQPTSLAVDTDLEIIPITLNWKLERQLASKLSFYMGAGAGIAFVDLEASGGINGSDSDVVFYAQAFAGLLYNLTDNFELYGGVRGIYLDSPDLKVGGMALGGNVLETDILIEGGGRLNF